MRIKRLLFLLSSIALLTLLIKPAFGEQLDDLKKNILQVLVINNGDNPIPVNVKNMPTEQPLSTETLRKKTVVKKIVNEEMQPNSFTESFEVDGYERITIYTECVAGKDIPLHVWSSIREESSRWYGLSDGRLECGRLKTTLVQGREYKIQYLGDAPSMVAIRVYLVP